MIRTIISYTRSGLGQRPCNSHRHCHPVPCYTAATCQGLGFGACLFFGLGFIGFGAEALGLRIQDWGVGCEVEDSCSFHKYGLRNTTGLLIGEEGTPQFWGSLQI